MNIAGRILDPLGPLAQLWQNALTASKEKSGLDPAEVIELVQRAIALTGNASFCALVVKFPAQRRQFPDCLMAVAASTTCKYVNS